MSVSLTLRQVTSVVQPVSPSTALKYRVVNSITAAVGMDPAVFVFKTINGKFDHYAYAADMEAWPDGIDAAKTANLMFYRLTSVQRDWCTVHEMNEDLTITKSRLQALCNEMNIVMDGLVIDQTTTLTAG